MNEILFYKYILYMLHVLFFLKGMLLLHEHLSRAWFGANVVLLCSSSRTHAEEMDDFFVIGRYRGRVPQAM